MTSQVMQILQQDHKNHSRLLDLLEEQLERLEAVETNDFDLIKEVMEYMTDYADAHHHRLEDEVFDLLVASEHPLSDKAIELKRQHKELAELGRRFLDTIILVINDVMVLREKVDDQGRSYLSLLREHINTEESAIFDAAAETLTNEQFSQILERFERTMDPVFEMELAGEFMHLRGYLS